MGEGETPERISAHTDAYDLLRLAQLEGSIDEEVTRLLDLATRRGWPEVACVTLFARHVRHLVRGDPVPEVLPALRAAAEADGDPALVALALAAQAEFTWNPDDLSEIETGEVQLARAVALLQGGEGRAVDRSLATIVCANSYYQRGLIEIEVELLERAAEDLKLVPDSYARARELRAQVVARNRAEANIVLACELAELGDREGAARVAISALDTPLPSLGQLPDEWQEDYALMRCLLAAFARRPRIEEPVLASRRTGHVTGFAAYPALGEAIRRWDDGDVVGAADLAATVVEALADHMVKQVRLFARALAALRPPLTDEARGYARAQSRRYRDARATIVGSARARVEVERMRLDNKRLEQRAYADELTGISNRHAYTRYLQRLQTREANEPVAVLMVDVDTFKEVNDTFGHAAGDEVLRRVATILAGSVRSSDLVARLGGDEFVVILDLVRGLDLRARGERMVRQVAEHPWDEVAPGLRVSISVGLTTGMSRDLASLLTAADEGLYRAKRGGRGRLSTIR